MHIFALENDVAHVIQELKALSGKEFTPYRTGC
jgi:hypothetical protein